MARQAKTPAAASAPAKANGLDYLREEYFFLQSAVEDYQKQSLEIKKFSIGLSAGLAFLKDLLKNDVVISMAGVLFLALSFWLLDWLWKEFQRGHYPRLAQIEAEFAARLEPAPAISGSWFRPRPAGAAAGAPGSGRRRFEFQTLWWPQVFLPHLPIAVLSLAVIALALTGRLPAKSADTAQAGSTVVQVLPERGHAGP